MERIGRWVLLLILLLFVKVKVLDPHLRDLSETELLHRNAPPSSTDPMLPFFGLLPPSSCSLQPSIPTLLYLLELVPLFSGLIRSHLSFLSWTTTSQGASFYLPLHFTPGFSFSSLSLSLHVPSHSWSQISLSHSQHIAGPK